MKGWAEIGLWAAVLIGVHGAARIVPSHNEPAPLLADLGNPRLPGPVDVTTASRRREAVIARNPFRLNRTPSTVGYTEGFTDPGRRPPIVVPPIRLAGIVGGPPWRAVLDGVPGHRTSVVAVVGSTFGDLTVGAVGPDAVRLALPDTTWTLHLPRRGAP